MLISGYILDGLYQSEVLIISIENAPKGNNSTNAAEWFTSLTPISSCGLANTEWLHFCQSNQLHPLLQYVKKQTLFSWFEGGKYP